MSRDKQDLVAFLKALRARLDAEEARLGRPVAIRQAFTQEELTALLDKCGLSVEDFQRLMILLEEEAIRREEEEERRRTQ